MILRGFILTIFALLLVTGCRKDDPEPVLGEPIFVANGDLAGQPLDLAAGVDGYIMNTHYFQEANGVYNYYGEFKPVNCGSPCPESMKIHLRDGQVRPDGAPSGIDAVIQPGPRDFWVPIQGEYEASFEVNFNSQVLGVGGATYSWDFGDGQQSTAPNPSHTYTITDPSNDVFEVCLEVSFGNGCVSQICQDVVLPIAGCSADFSVIESGTDFFEFKGAVTGRTPFELDWQFSSGPVASSIDVDYQYFPPTVVDTVVFTMKDIDQCEASRKQIVIIDSSQVNCVANFSWSTTTLNVNNVIEDPLGLSKVEVIWVDASGTSFTTRRQEQPAGSSFEILEAEEYEIDPDGHPTKRLRVRLDATLFNGNETVVIKDLETWIAVAYPDL